VRKDGANISDDVDTPTNMEVGDKITIEREARGEVDEIQGTSEQGKIMKRRILSWK